jgi:periplasmic copper chaperone A
MIVRRVFSAGFLAVLTTASVGACGTQPDPRPTPQSTQRSPHPSPQRAKAPLAPPGSAAHGPLAITDPWVKTTKDGMTAAFGTLVNNTDADVTVVSGASPLSPEIELHEVADSGGRRVMRPKEGGFVIPARGTRRLQPGGDHIMLMGVTEEVRPGARIAFTLTLAGGQTLAFTAVGKDFAGAKEDYRPGEDGDHRRTGEDNG